MNAVRQELFEPPLVQPTRVAMQGFSDQDELARVAALFDRARRWEHPWEVVSEPHEADCLLVATENPADLARWHGYQNRFGRERLIAYSTRPHDEAGWHLRRDHPGQAPSPLELIILLREVGAALAKRGPRREAAASRPPKAAGFNWQERLKILFVGSVGSGKTSAVSVLSEVEAVSTEAKPTDEVRHQKHSTTVAMDFGYLTLEDGTRLQVYGSPGQRRFDFMSQILIKNALGIVVLISNEAENPLAELNYYLDCHQDFLRAHQAVIGITHVDTRPGPGLDEYRRLLAARGASWPVIQADARDHASMKGLVDVLLAATLRHG